MPKKPKATTVIEARSLREQLQGYIYDIVDEFEKTTGMTVTGIEVHHIRKAGFEEKEKLIITAHTEL